MTTVPIELLPSAGCASINRRAEVRAQATRRLRSRTLITKRRRRTIRVARRATVDFSHVLFQY